MTRASITKSEAFIFRSHDKVGKSLSKYVKGRIQHHHSLMISLQLEVATKNETKNIAYNTESWNSAKTPTKK